MEYKELVQLMIDQYHDMLGDVAYTQAERVEDLELNEDNEITSEIGKDAVEELVDVFNDVIGEGAVGVGRKAVKKAYEQDESVSDLDIPEDIRPKELKAESFASAL